MASKNLIELTQENYVSEIGDDGNSVIMFYGEDCNACEEIEPIVGLLMEEYPNVKFLRANYSGKVAQTYQVRAAPFFIVVEDGSIKGRIPGLVGRVGDKASNYSVASFELLNKKFARVLDLPQNSNQTQKMNNKNTLERILDFSDNSMKLLERRYFAKDAAGKITETVEQMFDRVATNIALADQSYGKTEEVKETRKEFYDLMVSKRFMPNSPTLMNAGRGEQQLAACFVLSIDDNMGSIAYTVGDTAMIHKSGGGTGFSFSRIRSEGSMVKTTYGKASGPVSFMDAIDRMTEAVNQGGFRRGANMAVLRVDHPDIRRFIQSKSQLDLKNQDVYENFEGKLNGSELDDETKRELLKNLQKALAEKQLNNFNISVAVTDEFMDAVKNDRDYKLINPQNAEVVRKEKASDIMDLIARQAWENGEPGVIFIDEINRYNPTPAIGEIESTNPCGEQPLLPYEACNLGSINLAKFVESGEIDFNGLEKTVNSAVHFLDNVIDMSRYPKIRGNNPSVISELVQANRKVGLGIMGLADMLIDLGIPYDSEEGVKKAEEVMSFIRKKAREASCRIAEKRNVFPNWKGSIYDSESPHFKREELKLRNATLITIAPTGSISMIADASSGIEPLFAVKATKTVLEGEELEYLHPKLEQKLGERGVDPEQVIKELDTGKRLHEIDIVPEDVKTLFSTAHSVSADAHIRMQAAFQRHTDNAVSKTINFPNSATVEDIKRAYLLAYELKCKGLTVYRDGSRDKQIFTSGAGKQRTTLEGITANDGEPIKRPDVTVCFAIKTPVGQDPLTREDRTMYNVVGMDENGRLIESFVNLGRSGADTSADTEAMGRAISRMLQKGIDQNEIIEMWDGIKGDNPGYDGKRIIHSVPDGVSQNMRRVIKGEFLDLLKSTTRAYELRVKTREKNKENEKKVEPNNEVQQEVLIQKKKPCPGCGAKEYEILNEEGCIKFSCCKYSPKGCNG